jgi:hypothetical protein
LAGRTAEDEGVEGLFPFVFVLGVAVFAAVGIWSYLRDQKRRQALQQFALAKSWTYVAEDDSLAVRWSGEPFGEGDRRRARNVLLGVEQGRPMVAFDYQYDTESTDSKGNRTRTTHHYSVVAVALPVPMPRLQVTPEGLFRRAAEALGVGTGVELESEDFNRRFNVSARNPKFASDVLTPRTMEALLAAPPTAWRIEGSDMLSWDSGTLVPVDVLARLSTMRRVVEGIPSFVWKDNGFDPAPATGPTEGSSQ